jgi:glycosyltransferase involved in cell wall biosynthesis
VICPHFPKQPIHNIEADGVGAYFVKKNRRKICMLTTAYPRWPGDERAPFIHEAAKALKEAGNEVRVLAMHRPGTKTHETMDGIEIIRTRYLPEKWEILQEEGGGIPIVWKKNHLARLALIPFVFAQSLALLKWSRDCDILHANWTLSGMIVWLTQFIHCRPFIVTVHGSDIYLGTKTGWIRFFTKIVLNKAAAVIAISHDLADQLVSLDTPQNKISIIPEVIDVDRFLKNDQERENIILFVGSLIPRKGCKFLIQAFSRVTKVLPDFQLYLVGLGADEMELKSLVSDLHISEKVSFLGARSREEVPQLMGRAKLFVLPSLEEGLGVVLIEAIASGTPCVASRVGGIPDIITPEVGTLVPPGETDRLAAAILEILNNPDRWKTLSAASKQRALHEFSREAFSEKFTKIYSQVLDKP